MPGSVVVLRDTEPRHVVIVVRKPAKFPTADLYRHETCPIRQDGLSPMPAGSRIVTSGGTLSGGRRASRLHPHDSRQAKGSPNAIHVRAASGSRRLGQIKSLHRVESTFA